MASRATARLDPWDFEAPAYEAIDAQEALPGYEAAPDYVESLYEAPQYRFYMRQLQRRTLIMVPYGHSASDSYRMTSRGSRLFSKKPDIDICRTEEAAATDDRVASIWFDSDGPLPWYPRARLVRHDTTQGDVTYKMEARNFSDWALSVDGIPYTWILEVKPLVALTLRDHGSQETVARFCFSRRGLNASGGAEAGDLTIYRHRLSGDRVGVEIILCSLVTASEHFKKMGRHYHNQADAISERRR